MYTSDKYRISCATGAHL